MSVVSGSRLASLRFDKSSDCVKLHYMEAISDRGAAEVLDPDETAAHHHDHEHGDDLELNPAGWRDGKRYAWLLGIVVPLPPFRSWVAVEATGISALWFFTPVLVFVIFPLLDIAIGLDPTNPP